MKAKVIYDLRQSIWKREISRIEKESKFVGLYRNPNGSYEVFKIITPEMKKELKAKLGMK